MSLPKLHFLKSIILLISIVSLSAGGFADEVVIERNATKVGDFTCSNCEIETSSRLDLIGGEMTAGDLWQQFNRKGVNSVERLTFYVALEEIDNSDRFGLAPVEFKMDDLTASLQGNSLVVQNYEMGSSVPMAKLELSLPFDFMEKYSANSKEPIRFTSTDGNAAVNPNVAIDFNAGIQKSHIALFGFAAFWIVVFLLFNRLTKPTENKPEEPSAIQSPAKRQALSA